MLLPEVPRDALVQVKIPPTSMVQVIGSSRPGTTSRLTQVLTPPMLRAQSNHSPSRNRWQLVVPSPLLKHSTFTTLASAADGARAASAATDRMNRFQAIRQCTEFMAGRRSKFRKGRGVVWQLGNILSSCQDAAATTVATSRQSHAGTGTQNRAPATCG